MGSSAFERHVDAGFTVPREHCRRRMGDGPRMSHIGYQPKFRQF